MGHNCTLSQVFMEIKQEGSMAGLCWADILKSNLFKNYISYISSTLSTQTNRDTHIALITDRRKHTGSRHTGSRDTGSRHTGSRHTCSRHTGSRHTGFRHTSSRHTEITYSFQKLFHGLRPPV